ncbi:MAG: TolC family protein, partial [Desulforhabdus sp.]|nr:TolC family protein [Desulforhabdus sp.]
MKGAARFSILLLIVAVTSSCATGKARRDTGLILASRTEPASPSVEHLPELNEQSGLNDYLAYAALNNAGLKAAFLRWQAALEKIPQVTALPDPRFSYGYYIQSVETRVGPQNNRFGLLQTFPWFGKLE